MDQSQWHTPWPIRGHLTYPVWAILILGAIWLAISLITLAVGFLLGQEFEVRGWQVFAIGLTTQLSMVALAWWFGPWRKERATRSLEFRGPNLTSVILLPAICIGALLVFTVIYVIAIRELGIIQLEPPPITDPLFAEGWLVPSLILVVILAPLGEELFFRGFLIHNLVNRLGFLGAITISAILFAIVHGSIGMTIPSFFAGLLLAVLYRRTRSLWGCILAHGGYNAIGSLAALH